MKSPNGGFAGAPFTIPSFDVTGKSAIVTGSSKGLGYAMAVTLAAYGASVVINSRKQADCEAVAKQITDMGGHAIALAGDARQRATMTNIVAKAVETFGQLDIMVNNAGLGITKRIVETTDEEWSTVIDTNLTGVFYGVAEAAKSMIEHGVHGRIINIASVGGLVGTRGIASYCASKAGVISLTKTAALEFGRYGITVNAVCPGYVSTEMNEEAFENPKFKEQILSRTALRRLGAPQEVAAVVLFLASDASSIMTGTYIAADMGTTCN